MYINLDAFAFALKLLNLLKIIFSLFFFNEILIQTKINYY